MIRVLQSSLVRIATALIVLAAGCSSGGADPAPDAGRRDGSTDAAVADARRVDAGDDAGFADTDAGTMDSGEPPDAEVCEIGGAVTSTLPLVLDDVRQLGDPNTIDTFSAVFEHDCVIHVVWESANEDYTDGRLQHVRSDASGEFASPAVLDLGRGRIHGSPSRVRLGLDDYLYFAKTESLNAPVTLHRARFSDGEFGAPDTLAAMRDVFGLLAWPKFASDDAGGVVMAYRNSGSQARFRRSVDGASFGAAVDVSTAQIAIPTVTAFGDGALAYTYQIPGSTYVAYVRISGDRGDTWSAPQSITESSVNVHDATAVLRVDGDLDLYYIFPTGAHGFSVHRRSLTRAGVLGPEELVTTAEHGNTQKPHAERLSDGSILLSYARVTQTHAQGYPIALALTVARLGSDAPLP